MFIKPPIECVKLGIEIRPVTPPPIKAKRVIPDKLLLILSKYKYNWRLAQLAKPKWKGRKYVPRGIEPLPPKVPPKLTREIRFYADQISRPLVRCLEENKRLFGSQNGKKYVRLMNKHIKKSWASVYNYYNKKERDRRRRQQIRELKLREKTKTVINKERIGILATPKKLFLPEPIEKPGKVFSAFDRLDILAAPKVREVPKPRDLTVNPAALTYEPTENILKLAAIPERFKNILPPVEPGKVHKAALRFKITPRLEEIAIPKQRKEKAKEEEDFDPWAISKNALKYKATPRVIELARPTERD